MTERLPHSGGTYVLVFKAAQQCKVRIGALGTGDFPAGYYVYVGSAHGGGGLRARVGRHLAYDKPLRWHMDYLRPELQAHAVWWQACPTRLEDAWVEHMPALGVSSSMHGFGASDSRHGSHLFYCVRQPSFRRWQALQPACRCLRTSPLE